ncbi:MAG TPA: flavodoxin domain-containing protein [Gemmatimonadales bacterium]|nr:flavodoxin domain-containing protein [Gemmatimonadales bacterium]
MPRVLIVYGTTDGHTQKIAEAVADTFAAEQWEATAVNARHASPDLAPETYDRVVIAGSVRGGRYQHALRRWVRRHAGALNHAHTAFLSVCLAVLEQRAEVQQRLHAIMERFFDETGWRPSVSKIVAGALPYTRYGWLTKRIMKHLVAKAGGDTDTSRDYVYTDWEDLRRFTLRFARTQERSPAPLQELVLAE